MRIIEVASVLVIAAGLQACVSNEVQVRNDQVSDTDAARYNVQLGLEYLRQGRRDIALEKLLRALEQDPRLADAHVGIALVYDQAGEDDLADRHYRRAIRLEPDNPNYRNNYGVFLCDRGNQGEAERYFMNAARNAQYPTPEVAWTNAGICAEQVSDHEKAEDYYRTALRLNPRFADALWHMARLGYTRENMMQARAFLQRYQEVEAPTSESLLLGYRIETTLGDDEAALGYATRLREQFPDSREAASLRELQRGQRR